MEPREEQQPAGADLHAETTPPGPAGPATGPQPAPAPAPPDRDPVAEHLGPYRILKELGRGGMGVVYHARRDELKKDYALKVILAGQDASAEAIARFRREAQAAAQLGSHAGIVGVHDIGEADGKTYFAMEFVDGRPLDELIDAGDIPHAAAAGYVEQAARALHFAHASAIVHRDVKPANLLVDGDGRVHVADFGLATAQDAGPDSHRLTQSGVVMGTPAYMPPEQARGATTLDARADVWALGATLYELLVGEPPFHSDTVFGLLAKIIKEEPKPPRKRDPRIPRDLETIALKCLEKEPDRRYQSADALAADLERWREHEPIQARPVGAAEKAWKHLRRHRALYSVGAAALAAVVVVAGWFSFQAALERSAQAARDAAALEADFQTAKALVAGDPAGALTRLEQLEERHGGPYPGAEEQRREARSNLADKEKRELLAQVERLLQLAAREAKRAMDLIEDVDEYRSDITQSVLTPHKLWDSKRRVAERYLPDTTRELNEACASAVSSYKAARAVLDDHREWREARDTVKAIADLSWLRLRSAEAAGERADAQRFLKELRYYDGFKEQYGGGRYVRQLRGDGTLTLETDPAGATVECRRFRPGKDGRLEDVPYDPAARTFVEGQPVTLGTTPLKQVKLPMGSYLLIIRSPGMRDTRYPVLIERLEEDVVKEPIPLFTDAEIGEGFVYVPAGESWLGGDPKAHDPWPRHQRWVEGCFLATHELPLIEYRHFLVSLLETGTPKEAVARRAPRLSGSSPPIWPVFDHGVAIGKPVNQPAFGMSWHDAVAYCAWRGKRDGRSYSLPSASEWARAARGADGRHYVWGDAFDWRWICGGRSPIHAGNAARSHPVGAVPLDVSVFGIHDLTGSAREWCADAPPESPSSRLLRGGTWSFTPTHLYRAACRFANEPEVTTGTDGFRLRAALPKR